MNSRACSPKYVEQHRPEREPRAAGDRAGRDEGEEVELRRAGRDRDDLVGDRQQALDQDDPQPDLREPRLERGIRVLVVVQVAATAARPGRTGRSRSGSRACRPARWPPCRSAAYRSARSGRASAIGTSSASGGTGKKLLSANATAASHSGAFRLADSAGRGDTAGGAWRCLARACHAAQRWPGQRRRAGTGGASSACPRLPVCAVRSPPSPLLLAAGTAVAHAQPRPARRGNVSAAGPPHAWLFGAWTGGLFPVLDGMLAQDCSDAADGGLRAGRRSATPR